MNSSETIWLEESKIQVLEKAMTKWQKKAVALECDIPHIEITKEFKMQQSSPSVFDAPFSCKFIKVIITGQAPQLDEWEVAAKVEHQKFDNHYENIISSALTSGRIAPEVILFKPETIAPNCQHCESKRKRKTTFLLMNNKTSEVVQIGSTCIEDFIPRASLKTLLFQFSLSEELNRFKGNNGEGKDKEGSYADLNRFISSVLFSIDNKGYVSKEDAYLTDKLKTYHDAIMTMSSPKFSDTPHQCAEKVLAELNEVASNNSNFAVNLRNAMTQSKGFINTNNNYACAVIAGGIKSCYESIKKKSNAVNFKDEFVGLIKQRTAFTLTLLEKDTLHSEYGEKTIFIFSDSQKRRVKWTCWGELPETEMVIGQTYTLTATISKHDSYKVYTTVINRCKEVKVTNCDLEKLAS